MYDSKSINGLNGDKLQINEFKLEDISDNAAMIMIAKRGSGKSWVCRTILQHYNDFPAGLIIAPTDRMNGFYKSFFNDSFIHYKYESEMDNFFFTYYCSISYNYLFFVLYIFFKNIYLLTMIYINL